LIDEPNTYFYTAFSGSAFIDAWRDNRRSVRQKLPAPIQPPATKKVTPTSRFSVDLLEKAVSGDLKLRESFVGKFEITKRIHEQYDENFKAVDKAKRKNLSLYLRAADLFEMSYDSTQSLRYFNVYLKCLDTICAHVDDLDDELSARLAWHINRELNHFAHIAEAQGVRP